MEIYPFLGMNTLNYSQEQITMMLEKYFSAYRGEESDLFAKLGKFNGDIEQMSSNFFAGIKVYPPLGFDPWPSDRRELKKVESLYDFCVEKRIPITSHCSDGGFRVVDLKSAWEYTSPARWEKVLKKYNRLKLNLAHFGKGRFSDEWSAKIISLIEEYDHVYADFSCSGFADSFYFSLHNLLFNDSRKTREKLMRRVLFGSDFMINLLWMDSYCQYLKIFCDTPHFLAEEKHAFCCLNPQEFLFEMNLSKVQPKMVQ
ncbi:MAG: amidohydrolase family protein [Clostridia bacterium]|nr:amidohydrolase family protein [Clostridia bacterium]